MVGDGAANVIKVLLVLFASLVLSGAANLDGPYLRPQRLVQLPDGRRLNVYCTGRGSPTVMLEGGWTTETSYWRKVQPILARRAQVCSYDRAGYGFSDPAAGPRTAAAIEQDFANLIQALSIRGPIILMAHSLGSFPARLYADHHPEGVAALVLLDPPTEDDRAFYAKLGQRFDPAGFIPSAIACSAGLRSYGAAMDELGCREKQEVGRWANNRVENSHLPFRRRWRAMAGFRRMSSLPKFASVHASLHDHFSLERHLVDRKTASIYPKAMPVLLAEDDEAKWLKCDFDDAIELAQPYPSQLMRM